MEQQRERISAEARTKRLPASGPSALAQSPMVQQTTQISPIPAAQAGLPIDDVVRA